MAPSAQPTQSFVPVEEVRDGILILRSGEIRSIVMASSINLSLKSADEQQAVIMEFQSFLNSLDFSTQIVVQSRKLDIRPYLAQLEKRYEAQTEQLLKIQTKEYIEFIRKFTEDRSIMTKTFFIVVPYSPTSISGVSQGLSSFFGSKKDTKESDLLAFEEKRTQLEQRIATVTDGLARFGVRSVVLGTEEVIEVLYKVFNPGETHQSIEF